MDLDDELQDAQLHQEAVGALTHLRYLNERIEHHSISPGSLLELVRDWANDNNHRLETVLAEARA